MTNIKMEEKLVDLSCLESAANLREVVKVSNTVDGKLVAIPQEVVVYGLFVNQDMFEQYDLKLPETPEDLLECCKVFQENGIDTPIGANRWWLETFVFAQAYADLYNGENTEEEIDALNRGERKYSDYMRPGFEYLQELIDKGYIAMDSEDGNLTLTESGQKKAAGVYERHRVITRALTGIGADPELAESNACRIEHVISDDMFEILKKYVEAHDGK